MLSICEVAGERKTSERRRSHGRASIMTELNLQEIMLSNDSEQLDSLLKTESKKMLDLTQDQQRVQSSQREWQIQESTVRLVDRVVHKLIWKVFGCPV
jgi:hypothetical protein